MRYFSILFAAGSAITSVGASPLYRKAVFNPLPGGDVDILNYALTLEFLERKFYSDGLSNFTAQDFSNAGFSDAFHTNLQTIFADEQSHVSFLQSALGAKAIPEPSFSFPVSDVQSFVALSSVLEGVGTSAYLGAAGVIADKTLVPVAGSILAVEARHSSLIREALGDNPAPKPNDTPLDFNQVFSLAAQFITGFAAGTPDLPFTAFPPLTAVTGSEAGVSVVGDVTSVTFQGAFTQASQAGLVKANTPVFAVFFSGLDKNFAQVEQRGNDFFLPQIPGSSSVADGQLPPLGQTYVVLSTANGRNSSVSDANTLSGVAVLEVLDQSDTSSSTIIVISDGSSDSSDGGLVIELGS